MGGQIKNMYNGLFYEYEGNREEKYNFKKDVTFLKKREKQQEEKNNNLKEDIEHMLLFVIACLTSFDIKARRPWRCDRASN